MSAPDDLHTEWASLFAKALADSGVSEVVVSPGSRSTPLALAFSRETRLRVTPVIDERSAAFFALGQARMTGRPSVLLCTSGTAGAHYLPAVIEASESRVPLIAITADRPWEAHETRASQTIDQRDLFGRHARKSIELGVPDRAAIGSVSRIAALAVSTALHPRPGPVHVNAQFRKPLEPVETNGDEAWRAELERALAAGTPRVFFPDAPRNEAGARRLAEACMAAQRGVLAFGPVSSALSATPERAARLRRATGRLARSLGFPIFAEATSQARFGHDVAPFVVGGFDAWLRASRADSAFTPDLIVELFAPPTSPGYAALAATRVPRILVSDEGIPDPYGTAIDIVLGDPVLVLERAVELLAERPLDGAARSGWRARFEQLSADIDRLSADAANDGMSEAFVARALVDALPDGALLAIGNSLPVRDVDTFGAASGKEIAVAHQRGVAGIDGLVAGAAGARSTWPASSPVALLVGDVSAQHDAGSFALLAACNAPLAVVVVDNGGGRIFEELPIARDPSLRPELDRLFVTPRPDPQRSLVAALSAGFGVAHVVCRDRDAFSSALSAALGEPHATVIEAIVPPEDGARRRKAHHLAVASHLGSMGEGRPS